MHIHVIKFLPMLDHPRSSAYGSLKESKLSVKFVFSGICCLIMKARISRHCCALRNVTNVQSPERLASRKILSLALNGRSPCFLLLK